MSPKNLLAPQTSMSAKSDSRTAMLRIGVRLRFDCDTKEATSVFVVAEDRELFDAPGTLLSVLAPVCAVVQDCRRADPASERCSALAEPL